MSPLSLAAAQMRGGENTSQTSYASVSQCVVFVFDLIDLVFVFDLIDLFVFDLIDLIFVFDLIDLMCFVFDLIDLMCFVFVFDLTLTIPPWDHSNRRKLLFQ